MKTFGYNSDFRHEYDGSGMEHSLVYREYANYLKALGFLPITQSKVRAITSKKPMNFTEEYLVPGNFYLVIDKRFWDSRTRKRDNLDYYSILYVNALDWYMFSGSSKTVGLFYLPLDYLNNYSAGQKVAFNTGGWMPVSGETGSVLPNSNKENSYFPKNMYFWKLSVPNQVGLFNWEGF